MDNFILSQEQLRAFFERLLAYCEEKFIEYDIILRREDRKLKSEILRIRAGEPYTIPDMDRFIQEVIDNIEEYYIYKATVNCLRDALIDGER